MVSHTASAKAKRDTKWVEPTGRNWLTGELYRAGLDVARPEIDQGTDLIAYKHGDRVRKYLPIQLKTASEASFSLESKYGKIPGLVLAYVWGLEDFAHTKCYAMSYAQALRIMTLRRHTTTNSWKKGGYSTSSPSEGLRKLLAPFEMNPRRWRRLFEEAASLG